MIYEAFVKYTGPKCSGYLYQRGPTEAEAKKRLTDELRYLGYSAAGIVVVRLIK